MKKQQKIKEEPKPKKKIPVTFDQRFKDKKNIVGKAGVLDLLGLHQPFNLDRAPTPIYQPIVESQQRIKNPQKQSKSKRKMSHSQNLKVKMHESDVRQNRTDKIVVPQRNGTKRDKTGLPRISKSSANIHLDLTNKQALNTKQYWRGKQVPNVKRRANSQLNCISMLKFDIDANGHFQSLVKFQKLNNFHNKKSQGLKIKNI